MSSDQFASLEAELRAVSPRVEYPSTPDLAAAVASQLRAGRAVRARQRWRRTGLSWWPRAATQVAFGLVALFALVMVASPAARAAVVSVFRKVPGIRVIIGSPQTPRVVPTPTPSVAGPSSSPSSTLPSSVPTASPQSPVDFGTPVTLAAARAAVPFPVRLPVRLGPPSTVLLDRRVGRGMVTTQWSARPGLLDAGGGVGAVLTQFDTGADPGFPYFLKQLGGTGATFESVTVNGGDGGWIVGGHRLEIAVPRADGVRQVVASRLAANTLIWLQDGVTMRLETRLSLTEAMALAASIR